MKGDILRRVPAGPCDHQHAARPIGPVRRQAEGLHSAHRTADHGVERFYIEHIQQPDMRADHVADGDDGKAHGVRMAIARLARRARRTHATADDIGTDDMKTVRIDRLARPDHPFPPTGLARYRMRRGDILIPREGVAQKDRVRPVRIQFAIGFKRQFHARQFAPAIERQRTGERQCLRVGVQIGPWGETIKPCLYRLALRLSKGRYSFMRRN